MEPKDRLDVKLEDIGGEEITAIVIDGGKFLARGKMSFGRAQAFTSRLRELLLHDCDPSATGFTFEELIREYGLRPPLR